MGAALITAVGTVVVGFLVFLAQRLVAKDELSNISRQAEIIEKLDAGSPTHAVMAAELLDSVRDFRMRQQVRRKTWPYRVFATVFFPLMFLALAGTIARQYFDLGKYKSIVSIATYGVELLAMSSAVLPFVIVGGLAVVDWANRRRDASAKPLVQQPVNKRGRAGGTVLPPYGGSDDRQEA